MIELLKLALGQRTIEDNIKRIRLKNEILMCAYGTIDRDKNEQYKAVMKKRIERIKEELKWTF